MLLHAIGWEFKLIYDSLLIAYMTLGKSHLIRTQIFKKRTFCYSLTRTLTCAYQGVENVSFSECLVRVLNGCFLSSSTTPSESALILFLPASQQGYGQTIAY